MAGLLPMVPPLQRAFGIDQHVGDVLDVADFPFAAAHLEQRIVGGALRVGRIEQQHAAEPRAPAGGQSPVLALDVMDDRRARPGQQRRHDQANALAGSRRREAQDMLRAVVAEIGAAPAAEQNAVRCEKARLADLARLGPARGAVGRDLLHFARAPDRHGDRHDEGGDAARRRDDSRPDEDVVGVGVVGEPPPEEGGRLVDRPAEQLNQGWPSCGWKASCQAVHSVAPQTKASTTAQTRRIWPQRILVAFMATPDQPRRGRRTQARTARGREPGHAGAAIGRLAPRSS